MYFGVDWDVVWATDFTEHGKHHPGLIDPAYYVNICPSGDAHKNVAIKKCPKNVYKRLVQWAGFRNEALITSVFWM